VIDGYPRNFIDAKGIFETLAPPEEGKDEEKKILDKKVAPEFALFL